MSTATHTHDLAPASPAAHCRQLLTDKGLDNDAAVDRLLHAYHNNNPCDRPSVERMVQQVRREIEAPPEEPLLEPEPESEAPDDPIATRIAESRARATGLEERRRALALDALSDDKARKQLDALEADLAASRREHEQLLLARDERQKREELARAEDEREARAQALAQVPGLERREHAEDRKIDGAQKASAEAVARKLQVHAELNAALVAAGERPRAPIAQHALDAGYAHAMLQAEVPTHLIGVPLRGARPLGGGTDR